jgi:hypothetical protein
VRQGISGLGVLVASLLVVACGSGEKDEFLRDANAICAAADARLEKLPRPSSAGQVAKVVKREVAIRKEAIAKLGELHPPMQVKGGADSVLTDQEAREKRAHAMEKAAEDKDEKGLRKIQDAAEKERKLESQRAIAADLPDCAAL